MLLKLLENIVCIPLYLFSLLVPKNPNIWIFGAWFGHRYSDNPRYVFEYVQKHEPNIRAIWLSREKNIVSTLNKSGYEAYELRSIKGFWLSCRAKVAFVCSGPDDVNLVGGLRAFKVQLWHGIPLKKIKADDDKTRLNTKGIAFKFVRFIWMSLFPFDNEKWDLIVTSGSEMTIRMTSAFKSFMSRKGQVVELGNPRSDYLLQSPDEKIREKVTQNSDVKRIICYAPTFRGATNTLNLFDGLNTSKLDVLLKKWDALLVIKLHFRDRERFSDINFSKNVHFVINNNLDDINLVLPHVDILITDYSSVFFDYLLFDRPILFSPFDLDTYLSDERGLYEPYKNAVPGDICMNWDEILDKINNTLQGTDNFQKERKIQQQRFFNHIDQNNAERVTNYVKEQIGTA
jgi:CDP-glycerol glycerophosphotransferase (TagB/SpsB family)